MSALELKIPPAVVVLVSAGLMALTAKLWPMSVWHFTDAKALALSLVIIGAVIALAGVIRFRQAKTTANPMDPNKSSALVTQGIYRFSRNPMYLAFLLILLGWGIQLGNLPALAWVIVYVLYMNRFQIEPEERILTKNFGQAYSDYRQSVRRWF